MKVKSVKMEEALHQSKDATHQGEDATNRPEDALPASQRSLRISTLKKAIERYYKKLAEYQGKADYELAVRTAFQNLLDELAHQVKWTLIPEQTLEGGIRPDGTLRDGFLPRGYWEAKGPRSDLGREIAKKIASGYPLTNTIFENTKQAALYQRGSKKPVFECDMTKPDELADLLNQFFSYTEPIIENFNVAVKEFQLLVPDLARQLQVILDKEHKDNKKFLAAFTTFLEHCQMTLDPQISKEAIDEMLIQHLLTERLFSTIFSNPDFKNRNVIAVEIETVIKALTSRTFDRTAFLKSLDYYYVAIEAAAKGLHSWTEKQHFLDRIYENFFQGYSFKRADTHGIVYTPQDIVNFMCASVQDALKSEFKTSIAEKGVKILDPCTGTGNFIVNLLGRITSPRDLKYKYQNDLFCNEITLMPYYIASLNIEHAYLERMDEYEPFEGICFADTLELKDGIQASLFVKENTTRVQRETDTQIMVVIGNPPYNMGQKNENDNNKNRPYPLIDQRIRETYAQDSKATLNTKLYDAYVKFFRWATDRLQGRDGIVCFVSNNSFVDQIAFDGMRKHLLQDFTQIYHFDLHGNVRRNPKLSGTTHNVFGIQVGVGITIAIRSSQHPTRKLYYYRVPEHWRKAEKFAFLREKESITGIDWLELQPDDKYNWLTEGRHPEFATFLPMGTKEAKATRVVEPGSLFKTYSLGVSTNRDEWAYDFDKTKLTEKMQSFIRNYNSEVFRWSQEIAEHMELVSQKEVALRYLDSFVNNATAFLKWTDRLKEALYKKQMLKFEKDKLRNALYRPFCKQYLYFDHLLNQRRYQQHLLFPTSASEAENIAICLTALGSGNPFMVLATSCIPDLHLVGAGAQCFPYYTYATDGSNRRENITDWALTQFRDKYGAQVSKWDIFHYVYAMLHHPQYRAHYAENLKHDLPCIPLVQRREAFEMAVCIGRQLMEKHLNYEQEQEYHLQEVQNENTSHSLRVQRMRLSPDRSSVIVNESLTLAGIPPACFEYRLGNRSALEWVIDQYQVSENKRSGIISDPNRADDEEYIVHLLEQVVTVSLETVRLVNELAQGVTMADWRDHS